MNLTETADLWWKNAVVYCCDVQTFLDLDGDGRGDLMGLAQRIDYLADLGVTCLWLMPFYPTADRDDGYDITDFYGVDPRLGTPGNVVEVIQLARSRGIRVIIDFVMNHTSDRHPWFKESRNSLDNPKRDWYVWRRSTPPDTSKEVVFPDAEDSIWTKDDKTGEYYLHHFYRTQPDLNIANPAVREEIKRTMGYWLELGVSGFRVDAVPFLFAEDALPKAEQHFPPYDPHEFLRHLSAFVSHRGGDIVLLGEVNVPFADQKKFFGGNDGDELTMQFDFMSMQAAYLAFARGDARPLATSLRRRPKTDRVSQWGNFLRNHDELTLDKLTDAERQEVFDAFGPDKDMQLFDRGLRRRLPTMFGGDQRRIRMAYSLMFSLPGTPVLFYGEEIGMGENLDIPGRLSVRAPMQWAPEEGGGFSVAPLRRHTRPMPKGVLGPECINVADQRNDPASLLQFFKILIQRYRQSPEIGWSTVEVLKGTPKQVLAHVCRVDDWATVMVHNLADEPLTLELTLPDVEEGTELIDLVSSGDPTRLTVGAAGRIELSIEGYGYRWLRVCPEGDRRIH